MGGDEIDYQNRKLFAGKSWEKKKEFGNLVTCVGYKVDITCAHLQQLFFSTEKKKFSFINKKKIVVLSTKKMVHAV